MGLICCPEFNRAVKNKTPMFPCDQPRGLMYLPWRRVLPSTKAPGESDNQTVLVVVQQGASSYGDFVVFLFFILSSSSLYIL